MIFRKFFKGAAVAAIATAGMAVTGLDVAEAAKPLEVYAELPRTNQVRVSPNGKKLAMVSPHKGYLSIFIYDLENPGGKVKVLPAPEGALLKTITWGSDNHILSRAQFRRKGGRGKMRKFGSEFSRWVSTNVNTGKSVIMLNEKIYDQDGSAGSRVAGGAGSGGQQGGSYVSQLPNDPNHILMGWGEYAGKPVLRHLKVNLETGEESLASTFPWATSRVVLDPDGERVLARAEYNRRNGKYEVWSGDGLSGSALFSETFDTDENPKLGLITVMPGTGKLLMIRYEQPSLNLFTIDPASGATAPYRINADVPSGYDYGPIFDQYTDELIGISYADDYNQEVYTAEPYKSWHAKAKKAFKGKRVSILSRTRDNSAVTLFVSGDNDAGEYYLFEPMVGRASPLGERYPELQARDVGRTVRVDYTARDGLKIPAYLTLPPGKTVNSGPMPIVAMPHGGPIARDTAEFDWWAQYIASRGYAVFKPQFRGSTGLGYDYVEKGYGEFGVGMVEDTVDGVKHLIAKGIANPDKMCVTGASYGGYQAFALPVMEPDMFKCSLALNGVSDIPAILKYEVARGGRNGAPIKFWNRVIGDYYEDRDAQKAQSPAENVEKIKTEIVIMHGEDDMTVPYEQSTIMAKAMKKQGQSGKVIVLKNDDHFLSLPESRRKVLEESEKLFSKHLD